MAQITITINESDSYGDGWQGQWVRIFDSNGVEVAAHTLESGSAGSDTFTLSDGADYTWTFGEGTYINEASFTMVRDDTGEVLAQAQFEAANGSFSLGEAVEVVPVYHYLNLLEASIDVDGELQNAPGFDIDFDEFGPPNSYTVDAENEQLVLSTSLATGDGAAPNFKAELPDIGPGGSIVLKLAGWTFGASAGLGTDEGEPTRHSDTMASEQIAIVLQEYQSDSLDNAESQQFLNIDFLRNELGGSDSWHDLTFDVFSGNYEGAPGWHGVEDAGAGALGVYAGTDWGLNWWPNKMVAAHWNHATAAGRTGLTDFLAGLDSPYSGGSIENDSVHEAYNKLIQQFFGYYRFSRTGSNTIRIHYSPDGSTWLLVEESSDFNVQNRMGLHLWCRLSDSVVRFEDIIASENTLITNVDEAISAAQAPAEAPADITSDLVGRWSFESDASDSVGDRDLTMGNGAAVADGAMGLPNYNSGAYPSSPVVLAPRYTISIWFKDLKDRSGATSGWLMFDATSAGGGSNGNHGGSSGGYTMSIYTGDELGAWDTAWRGSGFTMVSGDYTGWHHILASFDNGTLTYYVDGVQAGNSVTYAGQPDIEIFGSWLNYSYGAAAELDDIRVWQRALTAADVTALYDAGRDPVEAPASGYAMTALDGTTDAPTGDVGFAKGDEDGFFLQSSGSYVVWFKVGGVWSKHQDGSYSGGMGFAWPASATHAYAQMSAGGQKSFMFPRTELVGMLYDSDDVDSSADKFTSAGMSYDVTEVTVTVSGTTPMDLGMASSFVQVVEAGVLSGAYSVSTGGSTVVSPPEGKDGVELLVRVFS